VIAATNCDLNGMIADKVPHYVDEKIANRSKEYFESNTSNVV